jgi:predicted DsbA family dithiol-disulfide isomerase
MANPGLGSAHTLPRFLLPRLSWIAVPAHGQTIRTLSALSYRCPHLPKPVERPLTRIPTGARPHGARSKPSILQSPSIHRAFHATARQCRDHHFDTLKFVQRLQEEGFSEKQAVAMMRVLSDVIEERSGYIPLPSK